MTNASTNGPCSNLTFRANNRIASIGTVNPTYDGSGNITNDGVNSYTWDAEGRQLTVGGGRSYVYNALGQQVEWSNLSFDFLYDKDGRWVYFVNEIDGSQTYSEIPFLGGRYLGSYRNDGTHLTHANRLGSTTMETNASGGVMEDLLFYPWGQFWRQGTSGWSFASMPYRDQPLGHDLTPNRIYDYGATERWMTPDPAGRGAVHLDDPQSWNAYAYVRNNPTTLTDPTGLRIDSSQCDANKQCAQWKANYLKHKKAQKQWKMLDENKDLLVKLKWDPKSGKSVTGDYKWNDAGALTDVTVTLAGKTGHVDNPMSSSEGYVFGSTIKTDPLRQAYVIAHEFGHVEQAQEPGINVLYNWMSQQGSRLSQAEQQYGPVGYSRLDWTGPLEHTLDALHLTLEQGADTRAKEVVTGDDDQ